MSGYKGQIRGSLKPIVGFSSKSSQSKTAQIGITSCRIKLLKLKDAVNKNLAVIKQEVSYQASYGNTQHKRVFDRWHPWLLSGLGMLVSLEQRAQK